MQQQSDASKKTIKNPDISLPKGGGAITGIGETFHPNTFTGTGSYSVPVPATKARGYDPQLSIDYNSGSGNGPFGLGFSLSLPKISIRTEKGIPKYEGKDIFTMGSGELVPKHKERYKDKEGWNVYEYLPRIESEFRLIEQHVKEDKSESYWKITSNSNEVSYYGLTNKSRIYNPNDPSQIFQWLVDKSEDTRGNKIQYTYKQENDEGTSNKIWEKGRSFNNKYIEKIKYGNYWDTNNKEQFAFEVVFDYGEYNIQGLDKGGHNPCEPFGKWKYRPDAFSSYLSGFEIRTCRLCQNILIFHCFENELGDPTLVKNVNLSYKEVNTYGKTKLAGLSTISEIKLSGYKRNGKKALDSYQVQHMPPVKFSSSEFNPPENPEFKELEINGNPIPGYLDMNGFQPVDFNREGVSGLLYHGGNTIYYCEPEGGGEYAVPDTPTHFPLDRNFKKGNISLVDLEGNGELELLVTDLNRTGFYQKNADDTWKNYQEFESYPTDYANSDFEMAGLNNNGKTDLLLAKKNNILVYASIGKKGYLQPEKQLLPVGFPKIKKDYQKERVGFANMLGDGLSHRIKISDGSVECWPNLGYGKFGNKITMGNAPRMGQYFDASRVFLADIDGSGTIDYIYIHADRIELFLNNSGNSFSDAVTVNLPNTFSAVDQLSFADITGNGTACLVYTKASPETKHYYYDFVGEVMVDGKKQKSLKPYLLNEIDNNLGSVTQIQYCSSTKFYLEDKKAGSPWITKLPFPVQLVEKTIVSDKITGSRYTQQFKYHDGYYDPVEKQFRGFGFVESWDTEEYEDFLKGNANDEVKPSNIDKENYVPPLYTRTWHHTGVYINSKSVSTHYKSQYFKGDKKAYDFPDSVFDNEIYMEDAATIRQAYAALSGRVLRTEVYSEDKDKHPRLYKNPYTAEESNVEVTLFQKKGNGKYAVFIVNPRESIKYQYERNPRDPRVQQNFTLKVDQFGNTLQECSVYLPRRSGKEITSLIYPEQQQIKAVVNLKGYVDPLPGSLYCKLACEEQSLELVGLDIKQEAYFDYKLIKTQVESALQNRVPYGGNITPDTLQARQIQWNRTYFWNEQQTEALPARKISIRALTHHYEDAVFDKEFITQVYTNRITDETIQSMGGYFFDSDTNYWWNKGLVQHYFTPDAPHNYYMPDITENSFVDKTSALFSKTTIGYDQYCLFPTIMNQYIDEGIKNTVMAEIDYLTCQPKQLTDINSNISQALFDPLGQVIVTSVFGTENGAKVGGMTLYPNEKTPAEYQPLVNASFEEVINNPKKYLQGAASYFYYNLNAWADKQQPASSVNLIRNNYWHSQDKDNVPYCQVLINYNDGLGQELEKKKLCDPGPAFIRNTEGVLVRDKENNPVLENTNTRWQVSARTVYNNKGKPFEQYLPYFINTPNYEEQQDIPCPPPTITHYDPLGREIRVDTPKGFFSKVEFTPWQEIHYDEDDTVVDSRYYKQNYPDKLNPGQLDAINKAVKFYNTPTTKAIDNVGNVFLEIQNNLGNITQNAFDEIVKGTTVTSLEVWNELKAKDYITEDSVHKQFTWLTDKFQPYEKGFILNLDNKFKPLSEKITNILRQNCLTSYYKTDISGRNTESIDPRLYYSNCKKNTKYYNFKYEYPMADKTPAMVNSADAGTSKYMGNIFGDQYWSWSARNYCQLMSYDRLQRKKELNVKKITNPGPVKSYNDFNLVEVFTYGETQPNAEDKNLKGRLYQLKDLSGIITNSAYSIQGEITQASRQMLKDYKNAANWNNTPALEKEVYRSKFQHNAVKQLIRETNPNNSITTNTYNQAGQLKTVKVEFNDKSVQQIINNIEYDAQGQRTAISYGNGVDTNYSYEKTTLRLDTIKSTRPSGTNGQTEIQNLEYYYDPVGNITRTTDKTIDDVFSKNQKVEPVSNYTYDALYRLKHANGRQHQGINANTYKNNTADGSFKQSIYGPAPSVNDAGKLENYSEAYAYDDSGNLIKKQHTAKSASWTKDTAVENNSNRLQGQDYDLSGNLRKLDINSSVNLSFNCCENLVKAAIIERPNEPDDADYYMYDNQEKRSRKVSELMAHNGQVTLIEDKIYLGNYEIKRNYAGSVEQPSDINFERQVMRIMDDKICVAIINYISIDKQHPEKEKTRQCRFQMDNNLGSVTLEMDKNAQLITYEEYYPYGGTAIITGVNETEVKLKEYRYSGKERDDSTGLYYYGVRYYAPWLGRWLKPDPEGPVDGMNLFAFVGGNPITKADYDGRWAYVPLVISALSTAYTSYKIASDKGLSGWKLAAATIGGGVLGGSTGALGNKIATSTIPLAQTLSMAFTSTTTSAVLSYASSGDVSTTTSFGAVTYDWSKGSLSYPLKSGNSTLDNFTLLMGASANLTDLVSLYGGGTNVDLLTNDPTGLWKGNMTDPNTKVGHSAIVGPGVDVSVGPGEAFTDLFSTVKGSYWNNYKGDPKTWTVPIYNVNKKILSGITSNIKSSTDSMGKALLWSLKTNSCVGHTGDALMLTGANIFGSLGLHPTFLHAGMAARHLGILANPTHAIKEKPKEEHKKKI